MRDVEGLSEEALAESIVRKPTVARSGATPQRRPKSSWSRRIATIVDAQ